MSDVPMDDPVPHGVAGPPVRLREAMQPADAVLWSLSLIHI